MATWLGGLVITVSWVGWDQAHDAAPGWRAWVAAAAVLVALVAALGAWRHQAVGQLVWDGQVWRWDSGRHASGVTDYDVAVVADWQHRLVLRLENAAGVSLWLWAERRTFPERWLDLRRAVYSFRRPSPAVRFDGSASAGTSPAVAASVSLRAFDTPSHLS